MTTGWRVQRVRGPAGVLHRQSADTMRRISCRDVRVLHATSPALVLGSSQLESDLDSEAVADAGLEIVRRQSGGGAVIVGPGEVVWVDLVIPTGDPLWDSDIGRAAWWVGEAWAGALEALNVGPRQVWKQAMRTSSWSGRVCFAGVGPGEVLVGDRKVVGVSQRRTREAVLFQTAALLKWDPVALLGFFRPGPMAPAAAVADLAGAARGLGVERADALVDALIDSLP